MAFFTEYCLPEIFTLLLIGALLQGRAFELKSHPYRYLMEVSIAVALIACSEYYFLYMNESKGGVAIWAHTPSHYYNK
jgi:hypothetical protein